MTQVPGALSADELAKARDIVDTTAGKLLNGEALDDADRTKALRLYGRVATTVFADGTATDEDVVRSTAALMIVGGASFGDAIKYMVDCLTGNPVSAGDLAD